MRSVLLWILGLVSLGAAVFFWRHAADLQNHDGFVIQATATNADLARPEGHRGQDRRSPITAAPGVGTRRTRYRRFPGKLVTDPAWPNCAPPSARLAVEGTISNRRPGGARALLAIDRWPTRSIRPGDGRGERHFLAGIGADPAYTRPPAACATRRSRRSRPGAQPTAERERDGPLPGDVHRGHRVRQPVQIGRGGDLRAREADSGLGRGHPADEAGGETFKPSFPTVWPMVSPGQGSIPPRQTLVFQVELLECRVPAPATPQRPFIGRSSAYTSPPRGIAAVQQRCKRGAR